MQHPIVGVIDGEGRDEESLVAEAYEHVADGFSRALAVIGLPECEIADLRQCYRAAAELARRPTLVALQSPAEGHRISRQVG